MAKLKTETNTPAMRKRVLAAARAHLGGRLGYTAAFEHGQWWILRSNGAQYSVVDAEGPRTTDGFDFEMVTSPTED
jgi:hypothetical protein